MYSSRPQNLVFGIDLDDTITAAPKLFKKIIGLIKKEGHSVWIVTARNEGDYCPTLREFENIVDKVIFTAQNAKADIAEVDIWIDDFPLAITHKFESGNFVAGNNAKRWIYETADI